MRTKRLLLFAVLALSCGQCISQESLRYVDFHIHTSMKNYFRDIPVSDSINNEHFIQTQNISNWSGLKYRQTFKNHEDFSGFYGNKSYPQASWDLIAKSPASILCTSITPIEKRFVSHKKVQVFGPVRIRLRELNKAFVTKLNIKRQEVIYNSPSFNEFMAEYRYMVLQDAYGHKPPELRNVRLVKDAADLATARRNNEVAIILTVEGAHSFFGRKTLLAEKAFAKNMGLDSTTIGEVLANIDAVKKLEHHVFFVTLSHMTWNAISGQAKSLDMQNFFLRSLLEKNSKSKDFRGMVFKKYGAGIVQNIVEYDRPEKALKNDPCLCYDPVKSVEKSYGMEVLNKLLDASSGQHRILIDMRHMDIKARLQYIEIAAKDTVNHIPLIVSHAAVNGKSLEIAAKFGSCPFADRHAEVINPNRFYKKARRKGCIYSDYNITDFIKKIGWFHPFSINLFDEEISAIYKSDGIIGITLEERVLGTKRTNYTGRHFRQLKNHFMQQGLVSSDKDFKKLKICEPFMRNLLYIVEHSGYKGNIKSWEHIALGSDFDGMIDPLNVCTTVNDIPAFYNLLVKYLPAYAEFLDKKDLLVNTPVTDLLNKLFYQNGERFITTWYK